MSNPPAADAFGDTLIARTVLIDDPGELIAALPSKDALAWVRNADGIVGWGRAAQLTVTGADRFESARQWWDDLAAAAVVRDEVDLPGSGLIAFGSFTFAGHSAATSTLIVPEVVVGRRGGEAWVTTIGSGLTGVPELSAGPIEIPEQPPAFSESGIGRAEWQQIVAEAVARINAGDLDKVVLARDLTATLSGRLDVRAPLRRLADEYPSCWTFHVDGFFGSTPEMLVRLERGLVTSRVLAGTIRRTGDDDRDLTLAASLARSSKDLEEHEYAVRSVAEALADRCSSVNVPEAPFVLHLPNVMHLATDVTGVLSDDDDALSLAAALHPSAAVGGTPTAPAVELIDEIEHLDRGRYAGPVGWIGVRGDGEWGIGLRSAVICDSEPGDPTSVRLFAGCGIIADSNPADEVVESDAKLIPIRDALAPRLPGAVT